MSGELPKGWKPVSLGELGALHCGQSPTASTVNRTGVGTPYVSGPEQWDGTTVHLDKWTTSPTREVSGDTIFITVKGAGVGTTFPGVSACIGRDIYAFEPFDGISKRYIHLAIDHTISEIIRAARGDIPGLAKPDILDHRIGLAPANEQHRIVEKIDALFARSRRARDELARIPRLIERYRQAVLEAAFRGDLTADWRASHPDEQAIQPNQLRAVKRRGSRTAAAQLRAKTTDMGDLPPTWIATQIGDAARLQPGYAFKSQDFSTMGVRLLRGTNIVPDGTRWADVVHLPIEMASDFKEYSLRPGDIVIAMDRPLISGGLKVARLDETDTPALLLQRVGRFERQPCLDPAYLWHFLHSDLFIAHIRDQATGSDLPHISANDIETVAIPLPPVAEQKAIAERLTALLDAVTKVVAEQMKGEGMLARLDASILDKAFSGQLVPQDPADEPASVLLERIKAAKEAAPKLKRGRKAKI